MRHFISLFIFLGLFLTGFSQKTDKIQALKGPIYKLDSFSYNFGEVVEGQPAVHDFEFTNIGDADLIIKEVKTTCSCTASEYPREPVKPGAKGIIKVEFDTLDKNGYYIKGVNLMTNAGEINLIIYITVTKPKKK